MAQLAGQPPDRLVRPLQPGDRITGRGIFQQFVQGPQYLGLFFSTTLRPAPAWRIVSKRSDRRISSRPRRMVFRLKPVILANAWIPPQPVWRASKPTKR